VHNSTGAKTESHLATSREMVRATESILSVRTRLEFRQQSSISTNQHQYSLLTDWPISYRVKQKNRETKRTDKSLHLSESGCLLMPHQPRWIWNQLTMNCWNMRQFWNQP